MLSTLPLPTEKLPELPEARATLSGAVPGGAQETTLCFPLPLSVTGFRLGWAGGEGQGWLLDRRSATALYEQALLEGRPAALLEAVRGLVCLRTANLSGSGRWTLELELAAGPDPEAGTLDAARSFVVLEGSLASVVVEQALDHLAEERPLPRAGLVPPAPVHRLGGELLPRQALRRARALLGRGPSVEALVQAQEALQCLCEDVRELSRVARLKYEGAGLLRAVRAGQFSSRFLEDWLLRLDAYLEGRSLQGWEEIPSACGVEASPTVLPGPCPRTAKYSGWE